VDDGDRNRDRTLFSRINNEKKASWLWWALVILATLCVGALLSPAPPGGSNGGGYGRSPKGVAGNGLAS
jgi:hypothetical protein